MTGSLVETGIPFNFFGILWYLMKKMFPIQTHCLRFRLAALATMLVLLGSCGAKTSLTGSSTNSVQISLTQYLSPSTVTASVIVSANAAVVATGSIGGLLLGEAQSVSISVPTGNYDIVVFVDENGNASPDTTEYYSASTNVSVSGNAASLALNLTTQKAYWGAFTMSGTILSSTSYTTYVGLYTADLTVETSAIPVGVFVAENRASFPYSFTVKNGTYYLGAFIDKNGNGVLDSGDSYGVYDWGGSGTPTAAAVAVAGDNPSSLTFFSYLGDGTISGSPTTFTTSIVASSNDVGTYSSIGLNSNRQVFICYYDATNFNLKFASNATGAWVISTIDTVGFPGKYASLAIDTNGNAHISYYDTINTALKYATNASGAWVSVTLDETGDVGIDTSLAIDSAGKIHISYYDLTNQTLKYAQQLTDTTWEISTIDTAGNVGRYSSLGLDSSNKTHISYADFTNTNLKYITNASGQWVATTVDSDGEVGTSTSLAIGSNNKVYISYYDPGNGNLKYATNTGGSWSTTTILSEGDVGSYTSIALDSNNMAHISYYDVTHQALKYATNRTNQWVTSTVDDPLGKNAGTDSSIAVDTTGKVHISYYQVTDKDIKYAVSN